MRIIDLSQPIYDGMPVYPGDPEVKIEPIFTVEKDSWGVLAMAIVTHTGTHINVPSHSNEGGKALSDYSISDFISSAEVYSPHRKINPLVALIFVDHEITLEIAKQVAKSGVKVVGLSERFEFDLDAERYLLEQGVISYEKLTHTEELPMDSIFTFYGIPLNIRGADGSPVRAFAEVDS